MSAVNVILLGGRTWLSAVQSACHNIPELFESVQCFDLFCPSKSERHRHKPLNHVFLVTEEGQAPVRLTASMVVIALS